MTVLCEKFVIWCHNGTFNKWSSRELTVTSPRIYKSMLASWKDRHPSSIISVPLPLLMILGLTKMYSLPFPRSPSGLYTMRRTFTPTCGAASPTPTSLWRHPGALRSYGQESDKIVQDRIRLCCIHQGVSQARRDLTCT